MEEVAELGFEPGQSKCSWTLISQCLPDTGISCFLAVLIWVWHVAFLYLLGIILNVGLGVQTYHKINKMHRTVISA